MTKFFNALVAHRGVEGNQVAPESAGSSLASGVHHPHALLCFEEPVAESGHPFSESAHRAVNEGAAQGGSTRSQIEAVPQRTTSVQSARPLRC
jgi:hypothetical protein